MAEDKKGFLLYADMIDTFDHLTMEQRGEVIWWILQYVNDKHPEPLNGLLMAVIANIRSQLKRDLDKYEKKRGRNSESGKMGNLKRWNADLFDAVVAKKMTLEEAEKIANDRKVSPPDRETSPPDKNVSPPIAKIAVNDNVSVTGNDTVTGNGNDTVTEKKEVDSAPSEKPKANESFQSQKFLEQIGVEKQTAKDFLKNRTKKRLANTETAFRSIVDEINKTGMTPQEIIKICAVKGWASFRNSWEWEEKSKPQNGNLSQDHAELLKEIHDRHARS